MIIKKKSINVLRVDFIKQLRIIVTGIKITHVFTKKKNPLKDNL